MLAVAATMVTLVVLAVLPPIEQYFDRRFGAGDDDRRP
jgi:hypothetical protein